MDSSRIGGTNLIINKATKQFKSWSEKPNENWTEETDVFVVVDESELFNKIMVNYPYFDFVLDLEGDLIDITPTERPSETIPEIQQKKILELNTACNQAILNGFPSSCTGVEHQYKFDMEYQGNITQQGVMLTLDSTIETVMWPTSDAGVLPHTREQFIQLCKDAQNWKGTNIYHYFELKAQVEACTVIADVEAFVW